MAPRPLIFISAVSKELKSARQLVSNTLQFLGYEPVWQDIFGTEQGDLRAMLREKIDDCKGVVQLVGECYGAEPPAPDERFGRVSYTQYEALYAKQRGKKVWYLFLEDNFPHDPHEAEPEELRELQATYRRRLKSETQLYHPLSSRDALEASVLKLRDDLRQLRVRTRQWAVAVLLLLVVIAGVVFWLERGMRRLERGRREESRELASMTEEMAKLREGVTEYAEVQTKVRESQPRQNPVEVRQRTYQELGKQLGVDPELLQTKLPQFARGLQKAPGVSTYERANAAYVATNYPEAEKLALAAAGEAQKASPSKTTDAIKAFELAGNSAEARSQYADAVKYFQEAAKLTDRARNPVGWARQQWHIAHVYDNQGNYAEAVKEYREAVKVGEKTLGPERPANLATRNNLANSLARQGKYAEAEAEFRAVIELREKVLGPENPDTLASRNNLAVVLNDEGKYAEAETECRDVLGIKEKVLGPQNPSTLTSRITLANVLDRQGKYAEAETEYRAVIELQEKALGPEHPQTLGSRMNLANALFHKGKYAEAEQEDREVLKLEAKILGPEHPDTLRTCYNLALCLKSEKKQDEAKVFAKRAAEGAAKILGANHPDTLKYQKLWQELQTTNSTP